MTEQLRERPPDSPRNLSGQQASRAGKAGLFFLLISIVSLVLLAQYWNPSARAFNWYESSNQLAVGKSATLDGWLTVPTEPLQAFNGLSQRGILEKRIAQVNRYPQLFSGNYQPYPPVFEGIVDGLSWWTPSGGAQWYLELPFSGNEIVDGPTALSHLILNPFQLLTGSCFLRHMTTAENRTEVLEKLKTEPEKIRCSPTNYRINPKERLAEATYGYRSYVEHWEQSGLVLASTEQRREVGEVSPFGFGVDGVNASDFALHYLRYNKELSENIIGTENRGNRTYVLYEQIRAGNSCRHGKGCNNIGPLARELEAFYASKFPAKLVFDLWHEEPDTVNAPYDLRFIFLLE